MAPNITPTGVLFEHETEPQAVEELKDRPKYVWRIVWANVIFILYHHLGALYGVYLSFTSAKFATIFFAIFLYQISGWGIIAGAHRLWAHRSYKAKWPLQLLLVIFCNMSFQHSVIVWARDHRVHHKYSETDADPSNAQRGFFFAHIGWVMCKKHPEVTKKGKGIDCSDLESNPLLAFEKKYYFRLVVLSCFILPTVIPVVFWGETWTNAYFIPAVLRYIITLHALFLVNSVAHMFGNKPYNRHINPTNNIVVAMCGLGEGWHNYHHVFPWDYKTAELGNYMFNFTTAFIDFFAKIGWAYDLKTVSKEMIRKRVERTGDGSHELWGWSDKDQTQKERDAAIVTHQHAKVQ